MKTELIPDRTNAEAQRSAEKIIYSFLCVPPRPLRLCVSPPLAALLLCVLTLIPAAGHAATNDLTTLLQQGLFEEQANRNLDAAIEDYATLAKQFDKDRQLAATAVFRLGECYRAQGKTNEAAAQYQRILRDFPDQKTLVTLSQQNVAGMGLAAEPSASTARQQQRELLAKQIALAEQDLADTKKMFQVGKATQAEVRAAEREGLRLRQQLAALDSNKAELLDVSIPATSEEDQEIARIQAMIQNSPDLVNAPNGQSGTLLCVAAQKGQLRVAQFLLEHGADVQRGYPLAQAAGGGHKAMVELLLKNGASVNAAEGDSQTALHRAAVRGYLSVTETLLAAKADVNAQAENGRTPLTLAVEKSVVPVAAALLAHGADPNIICRPRQNYSTDRTTTGASLHFAVGRGDEAMVALLLTNRADLTLRSPLGESALDIAAILGKPRIVRQLIAAGADVNVASNPQVSQTPLHLATSGGYREVVALLLEHGANPNVTAHLSRNGATPLMTAAAQGNSEIASLLLKHKADPNLTDQNGDMALLFAIQKQSPATVRALLAGGANPDAQTANGYPVLVLAAANDAANKEVMAALIEAKANVNAPDPEGKTPLHWAAERNRKDLVELLVKAGADVNLRTKNGAMPLDYAKSSNQSAGRSPGLGQPPPLAYQWRINPAGQTTMTIATNATSTADLLRQNGALDELPDFTRIRITRQGLSQSLEVFHRVSTLTNQFTLLETVMRFYSLPQVFVSGQGSREAWRALPFPDFGRVIIRRPSQKIGGKEQEIKVSLLNSSNVVDCAQDVAVQFGDVIEIPESVHALNATMPNPVRDMEDAYKLYPTGITTHPTSEISASLVRDEAYRSSTLCLQKSVQLVVSGETTTFKVNSWKEGFLSQALGKTEARSALRSSSDLSRVQVTRKTGKSAKPAIFTVDVSDSAQRNDDLWLQDGDVIEVPEKR
jgi:ankyrin repeat protein